MKCIVPLAGPDLLLNESEFRPLVPVDGVPLVRKAVTSRQWWVDGLVAPSDLIFVLRQVPHLGFLITNLERWFPGCSIVVLPKVTAGALMTAVAGSVLLDDLNEIICVDLLDILYDVKFSMEIFSDEQISAVVPWFMSKDPSYSYFDIANNYVIMAKEKKVISACASVGTYIFRNIIELQRAWLYALTNPSEVCVNGVYFLSPALNGLIRECYRVKAIPASNVVSLSVRFKGISS